MAGSVGPNIIEEGLVFYVDAANKESYPGSGTTWTDLAGSNNGTLTNGPTFDSGNGGSIDFDGTNDYIDCGNNTSIQLTGDMTIMSWVKVTNFSNYNGIVGKTNNNFPGPYDYYLVQSTGIPNFYRGRGLSSGYDNILATNPVTANAWQQVAVVMSGTSVIHYLNSNTNGNGTISATIADTNNNLRIGNRSDNVTPFRGNIASVQIYNRALTSTEITQNYNALKGRFGL